MSFYPGETVRFKPPEDGMNQYIVVFRYHLDIGTVAMRGQLHNFYAEGYTPEQAVEYVKDYAQIVTDADLVEVMDFGDWERQNDPEASQ